MFGFIYDLKFYAYFGINIVHFARPEDFFLGWTRDFSVLAYLVTMIFLFVSGYAGFRFGKNQYGENDSIWKGILKPTIIAVALFVTVHIYYDGADYLEFIKSQGFVYSPEGLDKQMGLIAKYMSGSPKRVLYTFLSSTGVMFVFGMIIPRYILRKRRHSYLLGMNQKMELSILLLLMLVSVFIQFTYFAEESARYVASRGGAFIKILTSDESKVKVPFGPLRMLGTTSDYHFFLTESKKWVAIRSTKIISIEQQTDKDRMQATQIKES